jgi:hypothetical protein
LSGIQLYYKNDTVTKRFQFYVKSTETVRVSNYVHDYESGNPHFVNQVVHNDTLLGREMLYVQSMAGVKTKITFPHIKEFKGKNIAINKAELIITNVGESTTLFSPPARLNIFRVDDKGKRYSLSDAGTVYFGGSYDETTKEYRFRITRYIQHIILKDDFQSCIYLVADRASVDPNRLIFNGTHPVDPSARLRLEVYYTEY